VSRDFNAVIEGALVARPNDRERIVVWQGVWSMIQVQSFHASSRILELIQLEAPSSDPPSSRNLSSSCATNRENGNQRESGSLYQHSRAEAQVLR